MRNQFIFLISFWLVSSLEKANWQWFPPIAFTEIDSIAMEFSWQAGTKTSIKATGNKKAENRKPQEPHKTSKKKQKYYYGIGKENLSKKGERKTRRRHAVECTHFVAHSLCGETSLLSAPWATGGLSRAGVGRRRVKDGRMGIWLQVCVLYFLARPKDFASTAETGGSSQKHSTSDRRQQSKFC